jgi:selenocysteine lyase/cysteine desulfurase
MDRIAERLFELKACLVRGLHARGCKVLGPTAGPNASGITTFHHEAVPATTLFTALEKAGVVCSLRYDRQRRSYLRFSPHFYNTEAEIEHAVAVLDDAISSA